MVTSVTDEIKSKNNSKVYYFDKRLTTKGTFKGKETDLVIYIYRNKYIINSKFYSNKYKNVRIFIGCLYIREIKRIFFYININKSLSFFPYFKLFIKIQILIDQSSETKFL